MAARRRSWIWLLPALLLFALYRFGSSLRETREEAAGLAARDDSYALASLVDDWPPIDPGAPAVGVQSPQTSSNYYVVLDGSGSMSLDDCAEASNKITVAVTALTRFVDAVPKDANVGLLVFDGHGISERVPLGIRNDAAIRSALNDVRAEGGTPLRTAIGLGYEKLLEQARRQLGYGEYHLVLVTDGLPEPEDEDPTAVVADLLATTPVVLHTIGFCIGEEHVLNQPGRSYYVAADSPEQLQQGLSAVLAEAPAFDPVAFEN